MRTYAAAVLFFSFICCTGYADAYIPYDPSLIENAPPMWVRNANAGVLAWIEDGYVHGVAIVENMESEKDQKTAALQIAGAHILQSQGLRTAIMRNVIVHGWRGNNGVLYLLIRILPQDIIPVK